VPRKNIRVFGENITRTPKIGCRISGAVRRGSIKLRGRGNAIIVTFPINAKVRAREIGGVVKQETGTGSAIVELTARFAIGSNWRAKPKLDLSYRWVKEPGIDFLGKRIKFTSKADKELKTVIANIERSLERQVQRMNIRPEVEKLWSQGFLIESLNQENPPVWLRLTPQNIGVGRFRVKQGNFTVDALLRAKTEIVVGEKPAQIKPSPLGQNAGVSRATGFKANFPVLADYRQVEPVILRALQKLAARGIEKKELGRIDAEFESVTLYPTTEGKIAVGVTATIDPIGNRTGSVWGTTKGQIWLTGTPVTKADSEVIQLQDLQIFGDTDSAVGDLLVRVMASDEVRQEIERALVEDFAKDYDDVINKAKAGIASIKVGTATLNLDISSVEHGQIQVTGDGLFMPVTASGSARVSLRN
jgi:hypothetical protein